MSAPKLFVATMQTQGLSASTAIRGLRALKIQPMTVPELPCAICVVRKRAGRVAGPSPSMWLYRPLIDGDHRITACDPHTAIAVRAYVKGAA